MPIDDKNVSTNADFARETALLSVTAGASLTAAKIDGWRAPYAGKVVSAHVYAATLTDADDGVRVDLFKDAASILTAAVDPVAADTTTVLPGAAGVTFAAGAVFKSVVTTGAGDAIAGAISLTVRPLLQNEPGAR